MLGLCKAAKHTLHALEIKHTTSVMSFLKFSPYMYLNCTALELQYTIVTTIKHLKDCHGYAPSIHLRAMYLRWNLGEPHPTIPLLPLPLPLPLLPPPSPSPSSLPLLSLSLSDPLCLSGQLSMWCVHWMSVAGNY